MSVRSFHSVFMVGGVAGAALGCYLVSLWVASERAALESVETEIVLAQRDIRLLQTEIGTRGRLAQLERWNVRVLALSAPSADQFIPDGFQLARLVTPERKQAVEAPVVYASAPAAPEQSVLPPGNEQVSAASPGSLLHEAGLKVPSPASGAPKTALSKAQSKAPSQAKPVKAVAEKPDKPAAARPTPSKPAPARPVPVKLAKPDPLAPLPADRKKAAPAQKMASISTAKARDSGKAQ